MAIEVFLLSLSPSPRRRQPSSSDPDGGQPLFHPVSLFNPPILLVPKSNSNSNKTKTTQQVVKHPHYLLVTLVLCNAFATETLPLLLDRLTTPLAAVALSIYLDVIVAYIMSASR